MKKLLSILLIGFHSSLAYSESDFTLYNYQHTPIIAGYAISECGTTIIPMPANGLKYREFSRFTTGGHWYSPCKIKEVDLVLDTGMKLRQAFDYVDNRNFKVYHEKDQWILCASASAWQELLPFVPVPGATQWMTNSC